MRTIELGIALGLATLLGAAPAARPADTACVLQAKEDFRACRTECREDFVQTRFVCRGVDPLCGRACLAGRQVCIDDVRAPLDACVRGCREQLAAERAQCPPDPGPARDACVDAAQVRAFVCRDDCRERWRQDPEVQADLQRCRDAFRACVAHCPRVQ
jgi:hypothetical protein